VDLTAYLDLVSRRTVIFADIFLGGREMHLMRWEIQYFTSNKARLKLMFM